MFIAFLEILPIPYKERSKTIRHGMGNRGALLTLCDNS